MVAAGNCAYADEYTDEWMYETELGMPQQKEAAYSLNNPIVKVLDGGVALRTAAQEESDVVTWGYYGDVYFLVEDQADGWYRVKYNGQEVYLAKSDQVIVESVVELAEGLTTRANVVCKAYEMLGNQYTFGGQDRETGYDCSSLIQTIYKEAEGVALGRTTKEQIKQGIALERDQVQPGDLIFYGDPETMDEESVKHVGIYVGGNYTIHAEGTGIGVTRSIWYGNPNAIKFVRILEE